MWARWRIMSAWRAATPNQSAEIERQAASSGWCCAGAPRAGRQGIASVFVPASTRAHEGRPAAHAGREGAELVVLQFPVTDAQRG